MPERFLHKTDACLVEQRATEEVSQLKIGTFRHAYKNDVFEVPC